MASKFKLIYHPVLYIHVPRYVTVCQLRNLARTRAQICINLLHELHKRGVHILWSCSRSLCSALRVTYASLCGHLPPQMLLKKTPNLAMARRL